MTNLPKTNEDFAKKLFILVSGCADEEEYQTVMGLSVDIAWDNLSEWAKDDYRYASKEYAKLIMKVFEDCDG